MNRRLRTLAFFSLFTSTAFARQACPGYWESMNTLPGTDGEITSVAVWDSDGSGSAPAGVVMGGEFFQLLNEPCHRVAMFDGLQPTALGTDLGQAPRGFLVYQDELLAVLFEHGRPLQRWNGFSWQGFGTSIQINPTSAIVFQDTIVLGGWKEIRKWTGSDWVTLGAGLSSHVDALIEYQGHLIAGGRFSASGVASVPFIARWDGSEWTALGGGANGPIDRMAVHEGRLYAAGQFSLIGGVAATGAAVWDGSSWTAIQSSSNYYLASAGQRLFSFSPKVSCFENDQWHAVGNLDHCTAVFEFEGAVYAFGGYSPRSNVLLKLVGNTWEPAMPGGVNLPLTSIAAIPEGVAVANPFGTLGGAPASGLLMYSDGQWGDFPGVTVSGVWNVRSHGDTLYAWGGFTHLGGTPVNTGAARRRNGVWEISPIPWIESLFEPQDDGSVFFDNAFTLYELRNDQVHQLGDSLGASSGPIQSAVRWNGDHIVVVGGRMDGDTGNWYNCWRLDNGLWVPFGNPNQYVTSLRVFQGQLFGTVVLDSGPAVAALNGNTWEPIGGVFQAVPTDLCEVDGRLTALGNFTTVGGMACNAPAQWDGTSWQSITPNTRIAAKHGLAQSSDRLYLLTDACPTSYGVAAWVRPFGPEINQQPADANVCIGGTLDSSIDACGDDLQYGWFLNDVLLEDGVLPTGAVVSGASTAWLHIDRITAAELGSLMCRVSNSHGTLDSDTVSILTCIADFDCTGFADTDDFDSFVRSFEAGDQQADVDGSGFVDTDDFDFFVHAFEAGCP